MNCRRPPIRSMVAILVFTGTMISYMLRVNLNIAIVTMTDNVTSLCANLSSDSTVVNEDGNRRFCWTETQKGWAKASFFYGYVVLQVLGGSMSERFGTKRILGTSMVLATALSFVTPYAATLDLWALFTIRLLIGLAESVTYPSLPPLMVRWVPEHERAKFISFTYLGGSFGTVVTYPMCGIILESLDWEAVFYITGGLGTLWCLIWWLLFTDEPSEHPFTPREEVEFIESHRGRIRTAADVQGAGKRPPYLAILSSPAMWSVIVCEIANGWGIFMIITEGPNFISQVLGLNITANGVLSALPHLLCVILGQISGLVADYILSRGLLEKPVQRKIWEAFGLGVPAICIGLMGFFTEDWKVCIAILTLGYGFRSFVYSGHSSNPMDAAPNYSGTVYGFVNGIGCITGFLTPMVTAAFTEEDPKDPANWRKVFFIAVGLYAIGLLGFLIFAKFKPMDFDGEEDGEDSQQTVYIDTDDKTAEPETNALS